jgi:hypothetical protein
MPRVVVALLVLATPLAACAAERRMELAKGLAGLSTKPGDHEPERRLVLAPVTSDAFFSGLPRLALVAARLRAAPPDDPESVTIGRFEDAEADIRGSLIERGRRDVSVLYVRGTSVAVAAPPERAATVLIDVAAEAEALSADESVDLGPADGGGRRMRFGLLGMGPPIFKIDLRFSVAATKRVRADGVVLVRYDLLPDPPPERVSVFSGVSIVEPLGTGSRWTEVVAVGSPTTPPPLTGGSARAEATRILSRRIARLADRMR